MLTLKRKINNDTTEPTYTSTLALGDAKPPLTNFVTISPAAYLLQSPLRCPSKLLVLPRDSQVTTHPRECPRAIPHANSPTIRVQIGRVGHAAAHHYTKFQLQQRAPHCYSPISCQNDYLIDILVESRDKADYSITKYMKTNIH